MPKITPLHARFSVGDKIHRPVRSGEKLKPGLTTFTVVKVEGENVTYVSSGLGWSFVETHQNLRKARFTEL
jgi:hypothetical protein